MEMIRFEVHGTSGMKASRSAAPSAAAGSPKRTVARQAIGAKRSSVESEHAARRGRSDLGHLRPKRKPADVVSLMTREYRPNPWWYTETAESRTFKEILARDGVKAAIAWREARVFKA